MNTSSFYILDFYNLTLKGTAYLLQATLISLWWIGLFMNQAFFDAFQFPEIKF
jgi:hypothetical protein